MDPSLYTAFVNLFVAYLLLKCTTADETGRQVAECLNNIRIHFGLSNIDEFTEHNYEHVSGLTAMSCAKIAIQYLKLKKFNDKPEHVCNYYKLMAKNLDFTNIKKPAEFCKKKFIKNFRTEPLYDKKICLEKLSVFEKYPDIPDEAMRDDRDFTSGQLPFGASCFSTVVPIDYLNENVLFMYNENDFSYYYGYDRVYLDYIKHYTYEGTLEEPIDYCRRLFVTNQNNVPT